MSTYCTRNKGKNVSFSTDPRGTYITTQNGEVQILHKVAREGWPRLYMYSTTYINGSGGVCQQKLLYASYLAGNNCEVSVPTIMQNASTTNYVLLCDAQYLSLIDDGDY